jgi:hypothetical protein
MQQEEKKIFSTMYFLYPSIFFFAWEKFSTWTFFFFLVPIHFVPSFFLYRIFGVSLNDEPKNTTDVLVFKVRSKNSKKIPKKVGR